jgi:DNA-binding protein HU-beta
MAEAAKKQREPKANAGLSKKDLVAELANASGADRKVVVRVLDEIGALAAKTVAGGGSLTLPGVGKIAVAARAERQVRNPATGEAVTRPADKRVRIKVAKTLNDAANA